jgi:hypothetical protein
MTETKFPKTTQQPQNFSKYFGKRNAQPPKRSKLWESEPATGTEHRDPQTYRTSGGAIAPVIYGTAALPGMRFGFAATCLVFGPLIKDWNPPFLVLLVLVPALMALFWNNERWIFGHRDLRIEFSNALRTRELIVRPSDFLSVGSSIVRGSGAETYRVMITVHPGRSYTKSYPTEHEADMLKQQVLKTLGPMNR